MQLTIKIKERGFCGRALIKEHKNCSKQAWVAAGTMWHTTFRDKRFTPAHAKKAGYAKRKGEQSGLTDKEFWNSYTGQKLKKFHHKNPLQWSGDVRNRVKSATITSTNTSYTDNGSSGGGCKVAYPGASKLNFKNRYSGINMAEEFRKIIPEEMPAIARAYDTALQAAMNSVTTTTVRQVA
jgi:hypothetical protein